MFDKLSKLFDSTSAGETSERREVTLRTATAALLMEVARADFGRSTPEMESIERLLSDQFDLTEQEAQDLMATAETASDESASMYRFTHSVNEHLNAAEKRRVIEMLWRVALVDETLDKYEDSIVHKIAKLIYVPNGELMAVKHQVSEALNLS